jgi:hypothetical protein
VIRLATFVLGILVFGAVGYCVYVYRAPLGLVAPAKSAQNSPVIGAEASLAPSRISWQTIDRTQDGFRVEMPAGVTETQIPAYDERGNSHSAEMIQSSPSPEATFAVSWAEDPPIEHGNSRDFAPTLNRARDGALARSQTTLTGESRSSRQGYPESDFTARNDSGGILNARLILVKTHLYMLIATYPSASARRDEDVNRFFNSFVFVSADRIN